MPLLRSRYSHSGIVQLDKTLGRQCMFQTTTRCNHCDTAQLDTLGMLCTHHWTVQCSR